MSVRDFVILALVSGTLVYLWVAGRRDPRFRGHASAVMTSVGILGTFVGIFLALLPLDFSAGQMNASIQALLDGMRLAFVTSVLGLASSIGFRLYEKWRPSPEPKGAPLPPEQTAVLERLDAIHRAIGGDGDTSLLTQLQKLRDHSRDDSRRLDAIRSAIAGDGDSSLVTQLVKLREESLDGFRRLDALTEVIRDSLVKNLESLIVDIRNVIEKQLGDSLRELIRQIEEALIKQFGTTFVEFNAATQAIKKWQEDYRDQVQRLTDAFELASTGIARIAEECRAIPPTVEALGEATDQARQQIARLEDGTRTFARLQEQAREALPTIERYFEEARKKLTSSADSISGLEKVVRETFAAHGHEVEEVAAKLHRTMEVARKEIEDNLAATVNAVLNTLQEQMRQVATDWGRHMTAIAERCAEVIDGTRPR